MSKENPGFGFGGNEYGEYSYITLDEWNSDHALSLKLYSNGEFVFENEFYDDDGEMIDQRIILDQSDIEMMGDDLKNNLRTYLSSQLEKYDNIK